jgi:hypothetical protein
MIPERRDALSEIGFQWSLSAASPETPKKRKTCISIMTTKTTKAVSAKKKSNVQDYHPPRAKLDKNESPAVPVRYIPTYTTVYTVGLDKVIAGMKDRTMNYETALKELEMMRGI